MDDFNDIKQQNQTRTWSGTNKYHTLPLQKKIAYFIHLCLLDLW